jgi:hypothetical protein
VSVRLAIGLLLAVAGLVAGSLLVGSSRRRRHVLRPAAGGPPRRLGPGTGEHLPAFAKALAAGVRRLELDVRFTDGDVPVLMHDETVDRTTSGTGAVSALTLDQIRALDAGSWFGKQYRGTRVPTLFDILKLAKSKDASVLVELKTLPTETQMAQFLGRVRGLSMGPHIIVTSFGEDAIAAVQAAAPDLRTAIIDNPRYRQPASGAPVRPDLPGQRLVGHRGAHGGLAQGRHQRAAVDVSTARRALSGGRRQGAAVITTGRPATSPGPATAAADPCSGGWRHRVGRGAPTGGGAPAVPAGVELDRPPQVAPGRSRQSVSRQTSSA